MRVKLNRDLLINGVDRQPGEVVDVEESRAFRIVEAGDGEALDPFTGPTPKSAIVGTFTPAEIPPPELTGEANPLPIPEGQVVRKQGTAEVVYVTRVGDRTMEVPPPKGSES